MSYRTLALEQDAGALLIRLNRPEALNALSLELLGELREVLETVASRPEVRAVMLTGAGRGFSSGADLGTTPVDADIGHLLETYYNPVVRGLYEMPKPVVAAVNGVAAGAGMSLALACDLRLLSESASFVLGFTGIALVLDAAGSFTLPRLVGRARALELAYSNRKVPAEEALRLGLGERVLAAETFEAESWSFVKTLASGPAQSFALVKQQLTASLGNDLEAQLALEARLQSEAASSPDALEGVTAFRERRKPQWSA